MCSYQISWASGTKVGVFERMCSMRELRLINFIDARIGLLLQNARQILDIVRGTFPGLSFSGPETLDDCTLAQPAGETLSCLWSNAAGLIDVPGQIETAPALHALTRVNIRWAFINSITERWQFSKHAQDVMSNTACNYDLLRLGLGIGLAALVTVGGIATVSTALFETQATGLWTSIVFIAYGFMMFASSYVEEEQHFWYWASSSWLGWLLLKR